MKSDFYNNPERKSNDARTYLSLLTLNSLNPSVVTISLWIIVKLRFLAQRGICF